MSKDPLPTLPGNNAPPSTHPLHILLDENVGPSPEQVQAQPQLLQGIKTMRLCLPHPSSLDVLPFPTDKWSATTHPIKSEIFGFINSPISYQHFYFHQGHILPTKAFTVGTTARTVGNSGKPKESTELNNATGHNCAITKEEYVTFAILVLGLCPGLQHGTRQSKLSFLNMLLDNFVTLTNLDAVYLLDEATDKCALACILACFSLLMLDADTLTPAIVEQVWGQDDTVQQHPGGPRGDLTIICCRLILLACVANNAFHLWLNTSFKGRTIITTEALQHVHKVSATSFYLSKTTPLPSMPANPLLLARIASTNFNTTLGNITSPPYLPHSTILSTQLPIGTVTSSLMASTPPTPLGRKITSLRPMASPPSTTLHKSPSIYPAPPLSSASGYFPNYMALHGSKNTRHKGKKEFNKPYESDGKLNPSGA
jgi:hypothetical protein